MALLLSLHSSEIIDSTEDDTENEAVNITHIG